jgi:hypothetical protein
MRRLLALLAWVGAFAWAGTAAAAAVAVSVVEDNPTHTILEYTLHRYDLVPTLVGADHMLEVRAGREPLSLSAGEPELPLVARSIIIGDAEVEARVVAASYHDVADVDVVPSRGILYRGVDDPATAPYFFGPSYATDAFYPSEVVALGAPYVLRDYRGVVVEVHPFQYNPVTRVLRVYERLTVEVARVGASGPDPLVVQPAGVSAAFHEIGAAHFLNHATRAAYAPLSEQGDMLIIAHDAFLPNVQPLVEHKNAIGIPTTAVGVSTVGNTSAAIKTYIQNAYGAGNLAFVLLVGDADQVATPYASGGAADPTYSKVSGGDSYPDVLVGRFSATSAAHVDTQVQRTIEFEAGGATQQPWWKKGLGMASFEGPGDDGEYDNEHIEKIRQDLLGHGYTQVDQIYGDGSPSQVVSALNEGRGMVNYCGHGSPTSFGTTGFSNYDVADLSNTGKLPFVMSVACNTGEFDTGTSLGEALLRATSGGQPSGAIAVYASSISQSWNPPMAAQDETIDRFVAETYTTIGALTYAGSALMMDEYGSGGVEMFNTWILFGDPSLTVVGTVQPASGMSVTPAEDLASSGPVGGPFAGGEASYTVENHGEAPIDVLVTANVPWLDVAPTAGTIPGGGSLVVSVSVNDEALTLPAGLWRDSVEFVNDTHHEGDTSRGVALTIGDPEVVFEWPLDSDPGWEAEGQWQFGRPAGNGGAELGSPDPTAGHTGDNVYGYNLAGEYPNDLPETRLTTGAIDMRDLSDAKLHFWRWLNVEGAQYDHAAVEISADGATWTKVWQNEADLTDASWQEQVLDISALADGQEAVRIRWVMGSTDGGLTASGWNIDDVAIYAYQAACDDADGDGALPPECGGDDCADGDSAVGPSAAEECDDGLDNDCDGALDGVDTDCGGTGSQDLPGGPGDASGQGGLEGHVKCAMGRSGSNHALALLFGIGAAALLGRRRARRSGEELRADAPG